MAHTRCMLDKIISMYAHAHAHAPGYPHARTRKHAHTDQYVIFTAFPQQQLFRKWASVLRYTYIAFIVTIITFKIAAIWGWHGIPTFRLLIKVFPQQLQGPVFQKTISQYRYSFSKRKRHVILQSLLFQQKVYRFCQIKSPTTAHWSDWSSCLLREQRVINGNQ